MEYQCDQSSIDNSNLYEVLGVKDSATRNEIRKAFREKARLLHPDNKISGNKQAFEKLAAAYEALIKRR